MKMEPHKENGKKLIKFMISMGVCLVIPFLLGCFGMPDEIVLLSGLVSGCVMMLTILLFYGREVHDVIDWWIG